MLHLFQSTQIKALAARMALQIDAQRRVAARGPLEVIQIVVPHERLGTWLKLEVAQHLGIAANLQFVTLEQALEQALDAIAGGPKHKIWERRAIRAHLLEYLGEEDLLGLEDMAPIRRYLQAMERGAPELADHQAAIVRRYQLADRIATLFERYLRESARMVEQWQRDTLCFENSPAAEAERWQKILMGRLLGQRVEGGKIRWVTWRQASQRLRDQARRSERMWHLFGLEYIGDVLYEALDALGHSDLVFFYMFNPCAGYWGDLKFGRHEAESLLEGQEEKEEPEGFWADEAHAPFALRAWGFSGARHLRGLEQIPGVVTTDVEAEAAFEPTLLGQVQDHIAYFERSESADAADQSIRVLSAPHIKREVEVIANDIWRLMQQSEQEGSGLQFQDIVVLLPQTKREVYQTHIRAIFPRTHRIPFSMVDMPASRWSRAIEAVQMLLKLPFGRFRRAELLRLMTHPNVIGQFPYADPEDWVDWCERLKILHGADRRDHADTYINTELFHWDQGLKRLTLGAFMTQESPLGRQAFHLGPGKAYLPCEHNQDEGKSAARFILLAKSLIQDAKTCRTLALSMSGWAEFISRMISTYLDALEDREDEMILHRCRQLIGRLKEQDVSGLKVPYRLAHEAAIDLLGELEVQRGQHLLDGVCVMGLEHGSMQPSRVTFLAGLSEGEFPPPELKRPEDLCHVSDAHGQLIQLPGQLPHPSEREAQKYMVLKSVMNTEHRLRFSYVCWDARTAEVRQPSPVVDELLAQAGQVTHAEEETQRLIARHPEKRFDAVYFPALYDVAAGAQDLTPSFGPQAQKEAVVGAMRQELDRFCQDHQVQAHLDPKVCEAILQAPVWQGLKGQLGILDPPVSKGWQEEELTISLSDVRAFLECPLQGSARVLLRLEQDSGEEEAMFKESEIFEPSVSVRVSLLREVFWAKLSQEHVEQNARDFEHFYDQRARLLELDGVLPTGPFYTAARERHLRVLNLWQDNLPLLGLGTSPKMSVHRFGHPQEQEGLDVLHSPLRLELEVQGQPLQVALSGQTESVIHGHNATVIPNLTGNVRNLSPKYFMRGFLDYVFLCANTLIPQEGLPWMVYLSPAEEMASYKHKHCIRKFQPLGAERAQRYLQGVITDMLSHVHAYYMPIEAVFEHIEQRLPFEVVAQKKRADTWNQTSSDWGPVRDARRFDPPEEGERMAHRRFALYFETLGRGR